MFWARFLRLVLYNQVFLALLFSISLIYFIVNVMRLNTQHHYPENGLDVEQGTIRNPNMPFQWNYLLAETNTTARKVLGCRNSVQGKALLTDDRGYVCNRSFVEASGCCDVKESSTERYACDTCNENHCCTTYEHCISCCMHPDKHVLLKAILTRATLTFNKLYASISDQFELCLAKCRTSSQSVEHENSYRDSKNKHCYGDAHTTETKSNQVARLPGKPPGKHKET